MSTRAAEPQAPALQRKSLSRTVVPPIVLPVLLSAADNTIVATALPDIGATLGHVELLPWLVVANLIANTVAAPAYGRLADLFGRKRLMLLSLGVFSIAAVICATAGSFWLLLAGRVVQGIGGGGLMTLSQALLGEYVPRRQRGEYQGYLSACIVAGSAFGPVAGGFLTQIGGWHSVFLAYLPITAAAMLLVTRLPADPPRSASSGFDLPGLLLLAAFVIPLLLAVSRLQALDSQTLPATLLLGTAAAGMLFVLVRQQHKAPAGLLALPLLRQPSFWRADILAAGSGASLAAMVTFLPLYLMVVRGADPALTGLLLMPLTISVSTGSVLTGFLVSRTGRTAIFPAIGLCVTGLTLIGLAIWGPTFGLWTFSAVLALGGLCQGSSMLVAQITVQTEAAPRQLGSAAASVQLARALGSAFGAALAGAALFGTLAAIDPHAVSAFTAVLRHGPGALASLPGARPELLRAEIADAFRALFLVVSCFSACIVAAAATMPVRRLHG